MVGWLVDDTYCMGWKKLLMVEVDDLEEMMRKQGRKWECFEAAVRRMGAGHCMEGEWKWLHLGLHIVLYICQSFLADYHLERKETKLRMLQLQANSV